MFTMYIVGIILLLVEWYLIKHTYTTVCKGYYDEEKVKDWEPVKVPYWVAILWILVTAIPYIGSIIGALMFIMIYLKHIFDPGIVYDSEYYTYWRLRNSFLSKQL